MGQEISGNRKTREIVHTVRNMSSAEGGVPESIRKLVRVLSEKSTDLRFRILTGYTDDNILEVDNTFGDPSSSSEHIKFEFIDFGNELSPANAIKAKLSQIDPILIHDHGLWNPFNHTIAGWSNRHNIPRIITPHGLLEPWAMQYKSWKKKLAWMLYQKKDLQSAQCLHATAASEAEHLEPFAGGVPIATVPWGIDIPELTAPIPKKKKRLLFLSRIQEKKGLKNLVMAWEKIRDPEWEIVIAGPDEGGHQREIERMIAECGLKDWFSFVGEVRGQAKWELYRSAEVFVLPTFSENFGLVVGEALAAGVPVITTKGAPWKDIEVHRCGVWIEKGVEPLVEALRMLTSLTDEERKQMGDRGRKLIHSQYAWSQCACQLLNLYETVLKEVK